jgi:hypothetical protein
VPPYEADHLFCAESRPDGRGASALRAGAGGWARVHEMACLPPTRGQRRPGAKFPSKGMVIENLVNHCSGVQLGSTGLARSRLARDLFAADVASTQPSGSGEVGDRDSSRSDRSKRYRSLRRRHAHRARMISRPHSRDWARTRSVAMPEKSPWPAGSIETASKRGAEGTLKCEPHCGAQDALSS